MRILVARALSRIVPRPSLRMLPIRGRAWRDGLDPVQDALMVLCRSMTVR